MILADTSVVIAYERAPTLRLRQIITDNEAAVCGVTMAEMWSGVRTRAAATRCRNALADFRVLPLPDNLWEQVGRNQAALLARGVTVQLTDTTIATLAIASNLELWTCDAHFALIQGVLPQLRLFQEPP